MLGANLIISIINVVSGIVEILLSLRLLLKILGANPAAPFVSWVYVTSQPLLQPFLGMFPSPNIDGRFTIEFSTLFAIAVYAIIAYILIELLAAISRPVQP